MEVLVRRLAPFVLAAVAGLASCSSGDDGGTDGGTRELLIVVNAPFSVTPYVGETILNGTQLAVDQINRDGGVKVGTVNYTFRVEAMDNALSPRRALDNVRRAVANDAVAIVDEGTGIDASWQVANEAGIPICIVYQGGLGLVDAEARPNVFRIAPTDRGKAFRLAEYILPKGLSVAFLHDDTDLGQQGVLAVEDSFGRVDGAIVADVGIPGSALDAAPQVLEARESGATALLVWAQATTIAEVITAARSSGWDVPIYTPQTGADPLIRQQLAAHPEWVDGLTFASGRMTAERGTEPFLRFQRAYERAHGADEVGVTTLDGDEVIQPPEYAMYPYDFVKLLAAAVAAASGPDVLDALNQVDVRGANGDERGFNEKNHEGVVDDDVYFAVFFDMTFAPVADDPLSSGLPVIDQTR